MKKSTAILIVICVFLPGFCACGNMQQKDGAELSETVPKPTETVQEEAGPPETNGKRPQKKALEPYLTMDHYLTYALPDSVTDGNYNMEQGYLGGNVFCLKETGESEAKQAGEYTPIGWNAYGGVEIYYRLNCTFEDGYLTDVLLPWNHSVNLAEAESVDGCDAPAVIIPINHDLYTAPQAEEYGLSAEESSCAMWYVFFAREDSDIGYAVFLNREYFSREDAIALARSVRFKDGAFDISVR